MQSATEKPKKIPRKHVTTACVPCRESKIRCDGATPNCQNCQKKGKGCKYQHGDDKRKVSLRAATELFAARIDQLCQFIYDHGLEPPSMKPEDESAMNRVLDTLQIPRGRVRRKTSASENRQTPQPHANALYPPIGSLAAPTLGGQLAQTNEGAIATGPTSHDMMANLPLLASTGKDPLGAMPGVNNNYNSAHWGFAIPTAQSLDTICASIEGESNLRTKSGLSPDSVQLDHDIIQQSGAVPGHTRNVSDDDTASGEEDEAENDVIQQLSDRIGTLKLAGDGHLRFYGATSNLNLVDVSATQQRQRPDARTVRQDGQDILNHLRIGQTVDQVLEDHLVELYFTWQNPSAYVVDKEIYITARSKWRNEHDDTPFYSEVLTNAMCAVGSAFEARYHPTFITFPKSLAEFFADRAKALLEIELDSPCVATVQALVILSWHEGASNRDARGWLYSGMSMRLAFDLGLHIDMTPYVEKGDMSPFEANVRRAAFWGSYIADHFWGFYLGRPFRMNTGDITVPKPASNLGPEKEGVWRPYGLDTQSDALNKGLKIPNELISGQFAVLWEIVSPVSHILYGCTGISRHELQRVTHRVTQNLFAWKENLPPNLEINLDDEATPNPPHLLMLHMQYHQIVIFFHRPWVSKNYIQPRSPRQGPGYLHARRMCIESAIAVARLLHLYEKHYTFRRMNNQVVAIIFTAALMLLFVTISNTPMSAKASPNNGNGNADMVAHLNLCFRALDELGRSFENAKRTRDFLVSLQRRWQAHMRRSNSTKRRQMGTNTRQSSQQQQEPPESVRPGSESDVVSRKKSRLGIMPTQLPRNVIPFTAPTTTTAPASILSMPLHHLPPLDQSLRQHQQHQQQQRQEEQQQQEQVRPLNQWIPNSDLRLLSDNLGDCGFSYQMANTDSSGGGGASFVEDSVLPTFEDIKAWWESPDATTFPPGESSV